MTGRRHTGAPSQHQLVCHEFAVVLTQRTVKLLEPGVGRVGAGRPFPYVTEHLLQTFSLLPTRHRAIQTGFDKIAT